MNSLNAISPIDGRYRSKVEPLAGFFSEGALIRYRVLVEIEYFIALSEVPQLPLQALFAQRPQLAEQLRDIYRHFTDDDAQEIKEIEKVTNHDVKAVEYFLNSVEQDNAMRHRGNLDPEITSLIKKYGISNNF
jgi:adenylosuccinate lyase